MNKEKQIEEIAKSIGDTWIVDLEGNPHDLSEVLMWCDIENIAEQLHNRGYRKQSEGEWVPSPDGINPIRCNK